MGVTANEPRGQTGGGRHIGSIIRVLIVPGYTNSGPEHWQTLWERARPCFRRVEQVDWDHPVKSSWIDALDRAVTAESGPVCLVAHSLGCATVAHWAAERPHAWVRAALLVAPADVDREDFPSAVVGFRPMPLIPLPFPSVVVASSDDPYVSLERARGFAERWGSRLIEAGAKGHINTAAGFGPWPEGERILAQLLEELDHAA